MMGVGWIGLMGALAGGGLGAMLGWWRGRVQLRRDLRCRRCAEQRKHLEELLTLLRDAQHHRDTDFDFIRALVEDANQEYPWADPEADVQTDADVLAVVRLFFPEMQSHVEKLHSAAQAARMEVGEAYTGTGSMDRVRRANDDFATAHKRFVEEVERQIHALQRETFVLPSPSGAVTTSDDNG